MYVNRHLRKFARARHHHRAGADSLFTYQVYIHKQAYAYNTQSLFIPSSLSNARQITSKCARTCPDSFVGQGLILAAIFFGTAVLVNSGWMTKGQAAGLVLFPPLLATSPQLHKAPGCYMRTTFEGNECGETDQASNTLFF